MVSEIVRRDCSPKVIALMIGCWSKDIWTSVLSEMGQDELMGSIRCTRIPFILVAISQSHLSPLSRILLSQPTPDPKTHFGTGTVECFFCHDSHDPLCLSIYVLCLDFSLSRSRRIAPSFHDHDDSAYCQPHSGSAAYTLSICYLFLANWSVRNPALNLLVYN